MIDSLLSKEENQFLRKFSRKAFLHKITLLFEARSVFFLNDLIMHLFSDKPDYLSNIFFLETSREKAIPDLPLNLIRPYGRTGDLTIEKMLQAIVLNANVQISVLIFKHRDDNQLRSVLNLLSEMNEQPLALPSSPFSKEYSGNILAMKEGAEIVYSTDDIVSLVVSSTRL
ncbi:MAG: hypothetical protein N2440_05805 [Actinobacteria bacterium]|nr:hypothetical protein [Actinomycetota bacterium]